MLILYNIFKNFHSIFEKTSTNSLLMGKTFSKISNNILILAQKYAKMKKEKDMEELINEYEKICYQDLTDFSKEEKISHYKKIIDELNKVLSNRMDFGSFRKLMNLKKFAINKINELETF